MTLFALEYEDKLYSMSDIADLLGVSLSSVYTMRYNGHKTIPAMLEYRRKLKAGEIRAGAPAGCVKTYKTTKGALTPAQCVEAHEHGLVFATIRHRGTTWGWDHKCIWLPRIPPNTFREVATALDGPPRGENPYRNRRTTTKEEFDRTKCCFRNKGQERCVHYAKRLEIDIGYPEECLNPTDNKCANFVGEKLNIDHMTIHTGAPARHYGANGAPLQYR